MLGMPLAARHKWPTRPFALATRRRYLDHSGPSRSQLGHARAGHRRISVVHRRTGRKEYLEQGIGPNGLAFSQPMHEYHLKHEDAVAIIAYLRSLPRSPSPQ